MTGVPELSERHISKAICPFVFDTAERMGVDPTAVALCSLVSLASVISDEWRLQPKRYDITWTEQARIWGAIIGDPSILKSPVIAACTRPIDKLEIAARERHDKAMKAYEVAMEEWKKTKEGCAPVRPRMDRFLVENLTTEALSEVLRDDANSKYRAPAKKVLVRGDELSELLGNLDRYNGGRGGDRGAYLRLYNGGRFTNDRVNTDRSFACSNWSANVLGGIQPEPIQRIAREAVDDGLLQRFAFGLPVTRGRGLDRAADYAAIHRYEALFKSLSALNPPPGAPHVRLSEGAQAHRIAMDGAIDALMTLPDITARMKAALGKLSGTFARLCLIFHLIECASPPDQASEIEAIDWDNTEPFEPVEDAKRRLFIVPEATAERTRLYMREILLPHLFRADAVMFMTKQTGHAGWIAGFILSRKLKRITRRDITRAYGELRAPEHAGQITSVMDGLEAMGWVREEVSENAYRAPTAWLVNPKVHTAFAARAERERKRREEARADSRRNWRSYSGTSED